METDLQRFDKFLNGAKARKAPKIHSKQALKEYLAFKAQTSAPAEPPANKAKPKQPNEKDFIA